MRLIDRKKGLDGNETELTSCRAEKQGEEVIFTYMSGKEEPEISIIMTRFELYRQAMAHLSQFNTYFPIKEEVNDGRRNTSGKIAVGDEQTSERGGESSAEQPDSSDNPRT